MAIFNGVLNKGIFATTRLKLIRESAREKGRESLMKIMLQDISKKPITINFYSIFDAVRIQSSLVDGIGIY